MFKKIIFMIIVLFVCTFNTIIYAYDFMTIPYSFVPNQLIRSSQINANYTSLRNAIIDGTKKIYVGEVNVAGTIKNDDGTVANPSYTFTDELDSGLYRIASNNIGVAVNGVSKFEIGESTTTINNDVVIIESITVPTLNVTNLLATTLNVTTLNATDITATTITGTLQTAAQGNITSLGTLTNLDVDNININGNTVSSSSGNINLIPVTGSAVVIESVSFDGGIVSNLTSLAIGTVIPDNILTLYSDSENTSRMHFTSADTGTTQSDGMVMGLSATVATDDTFFFGFKENGSIKFQTNATQALEIDSSQKLWIGSTEDTNFYRSAANTLKTDDIFSAESIGVGTDAPAGSNAKLSIQNGEASIRGLHVLKSAGSGEAIFIDNRGTGESFHIQEASTQIFSIEDGGSVDIKANNGASSLLLSDTTNGVGLTIGADTNLYRNAANELKTDDSFEASTLTDGTMTITGGNITGATINGLNNITASNVTVNNKLKVFVTTPTSYWQLDNEFKRFGAFADFNIQTGNNLGIAFDIQSSGGTAASPSDVTFDCEPFILWSKGYYNGGFRTASTIKTKVDYLSGSTVGTTFLYDNRIYDFSIDSTGNIIAEGPYNNDINGETYRDLLVSDSGYFGYDSSTIRKKTNVQDMENISWLYDLRPVNFEYKKKGGPAGYLDEGNGKKEYGLIAEEVEQIAPHFVFYNKDGSVEGVQYREFISVLIQALKDQEERIKQLELKIN